MRKTRCHPETIRETRLYDRETDLFSGKRKNKRKEKKRRDVTPRPSAKSACTRQDVFCCLERARKNK
jgi:hypothetical protein